MELISRQKALKDICVTKLERCYIHLKLIMYPSWKCVDFYFRGLLPNATKSNWLAKSSCNNNKRKRITGKFTSWTLPRRIQYPLSYNRDCLIGEIVTWAGSHGYCLGENFLPVGHYILTEVKMDTLRLQILLRRARFKLKIYLV